MNNQFYDLLNRYNMFNNVADLKRQINHKLTSIICCSKPLNKYYDWKHNEEYVGNESDGWSYENNISENNKNYIDAHLFVSSVLPEDYEYETSILYGECPIEWELESVTENTARLIIKIQPEFSIEALGEYSNFDTKSITYEFNIKINKDDAYRDTRRNIQEKILLMINDIVNAMKTKDGE